MPAGHGAEQAAQATFDASLADEPGATPAKRRGLITADHVTMGSEEELTRQKRHGCADRSGPCYEVDCLLSQCNLKRKRHQDGTNTLHRRKWRANIERIFTDGRGELAAASRELSWRHDTSMPHRPQSNGATCRPNFCTYFNISRTGGGAAGCDNSATHGEREAIFGDDADDHVDKYYSVDRPTAAIGVHRHRVPRRRMFVPTEADHPPSIGDSFIDVSRTANTNMEHVDERVVYDVWSGEDNDSHLLS